MLHFLNADEFNALLLGVGVFQIFIRSFAVLWLCGCFRYIATYMVSVDYCPRSVERSRFGAQGLSLLSHKTWNCKTCSFFFNHFFKSWKTLGFLSTYICLSVKALAISTIEQIKLKICQIIIPIRSILEIFLRRVMYIWFAEN